MSNATPSPAPGPSPAVMPTYGRQNIVFERGEGAWMIATSGELMMGVDAMPPSFPRLVMVIVEPVSSSRVALFERGVRTLTLTDAGAHYLEHISDVFAKLEKVTEQLQARYGRTIIRLNVPPFFAPPRTLTPSLMSPRLNLPAASSDCGETSTVTSQAARSPMLTTENS